MKWKKYKSYLPWEDGQDVLLWDAEYKESLATKYFAADDGFFQGKYRMNLGQVTHYAIIDPPKGSTGEETEQ